MAKILIVDDASFMRGSLKFVVESGGHEVVGMAKTAKKRWKCTQSLNPIW